MAIGAAGAQMMGSSPSFSSGASASANSKSGDISGSFMSGDFNVGGGNNMLWMFGMIAAVAVVFILFSGRK